jgi:hypothetical protein
MTLNEKLDVLLQVSALRDSGNEAEAAFGPDWLNR